MDNNDPLIKYAPYIILLCIIAYWGLVTYLEYSFNNEDNDE
jgi:hypothetical protein